MSSCSDEDFVDIEEGVQAAKILGMVTDESSMKTVTR